MRVRHVPHPWHWLNLSDLTCAATRDSPAGDSDTRAIGNPGCREKSVEELLPSELHPMMAAPRLDFPHNAIHMADRPVGPSQRRRFTDSQNKLTGTWNFAILRLSPD